MKANRFNKGLHGNLNTLRFLPFARRGIFAGALLGVFALVNLAQACGEFDRLQQLARAAVSTNVATACAAIASLRAEGAPGLDALFQTHAETIRTHAASAPITGDLWERVKTAIDGVGKQRDCYASHLYWFTDFEQAQAAARKAGKPILSLRLLGNLDEELSCANSRFFRTTLYANQDVSAYLRAHFILHWKSVRPVPKVTIDFGDGRRLERTLTGNSIHYVLDAQGRVIDALPGLYSPIEFLRGLNRAAEIQRQCVSLEASERDRVLVAYHRDRLGALNADWEADLARLALPKALKSATVTASSSPISAPPSAEKATRLALTKMREEMPLLRQTQPGERSAQDPGTADSETWAAIAALHAQEVQLDAGSLALIRAKNPTALEAATITYGKRQVENPLLRTLRNLERSIAEDTVRNEYLFHSTIHQWLSAGLSGDVEQLNRKIYAELFLTPDTDPWLGLVTPGVFSALERNGLVKATTR